MATWKDGAAYAPIERPDGFATPEVEPLPVASPWQAATPGAIPPPTNFTASGSAPPLEAIGNLRPASRNPGEPFSVSAGMLSSGNQPGTGPRDPRQAFTAYGSAPLPPPTTQPLGPPVVGSWDAPGSPVTAPAMGDPWLSPSTGTVAPSGVGYEYPSPPGQPINWGKPASPNPTSRLLVMIAIMCCALAIIWSAAAPWLLLVAGLLTLRTRELTAAMGPLVMAFGLGLVVLTLVLSPSFMTLLTILVSLGSLIAFLVYMFKTPPGPPGDSFYPMSPPLY